MRYKQDTVKSEFVAVDYNGITVTAEQLKSFGLKPEDLMGGGPGPSRNGTDLSSMLGLSQSIGGGFGSLGYSAQSARAVQMQQQHQQQYAALEQMKMNQVYSDMIRDQERSHKARKLGEMLWGDEYGSKPMPGSPNRMKLSFLEQLRENVNDWLKDALVFSRA